MVARLYVLVALSLCRCGGRGELVTPSAWALVGGTCTLDAVAEEEDITELNTTACDSISLQQTAPFALVKGSKIKWSFTHTTLTAASGTAIINLTLDGADVFRVEIPLPAKDAAYSGSHELRRDVAKNAALVWNVQNHGQNTWKLIQLEAQ